MSLESADLVAFPIFSDVFVMGSSNNFFSISFSNWESIFSPLLLIILIPLYSYEL